MFAKSNNQDRWQFLVIQFSITKKVTYLWTWGTKENSLSLCIGDPKLGRCSKAWLEVWVLIGDLGPVSYVECIQPTWEGWAVCWGAGIPGHLPPPASECYFYYRSGAVSFSKVNFPYQRMEIRQPLRNTIWRLNEMLREKQQQLALPAWAIPFCLPRSWGTLCSLDKFHLVLSQN